MSDVEPEFKVGDRVLVSLPAEVEGWDHPAGASWEGEVVHVQPDQIDVRDDNGDVDAIDPAYLTHVAGGADAAPGTSDAEETPCA